jgi:hypothetical protein
MAEPTYKIIKIGEEEKKSPIKPVDDPKLEGGKKRRKSLKTFPRSILKTSKIKPVADPSKHAPLRKTMKKHTIRLLTDLSVSSRRKTIKQKLDKMSDEAVRRKAIASGISKGKGPIALIRKNVEGGMFSGFISS